MCSFCLLFPSQYSSTCVHTSKPQKYHQALPEALSVHGFLASIVNRVKHGDENIPRTVNPAKDATANARYDSVQSASQETAVDHDVVNDQCPPKKDAGETFVSFVAHVDNLANVM